MFYHRVGRWIGLKNQQATGRTGRLGRSGHHLVVGVEVVAVADRPQGGVVVGEHLGGDLSAAEFAHVQSVAGERRSRPARHERLAHPLRDRLLAQQHLRGVKGQG